LPDTPTNPSQAASQKYRSLFQSKAPAKFWLIHISIKNRPQLSAANSRNFILPPKTLHHQHHSQKVHRMKLRNRYRRSLENIGTLHLSQKILRRIRYSLVDQEKRQYYLAVVVQEGERIQGFNDIEIKPLTGSTPKQLVKGITMEPELKEQNVVDTASSINTELGGSLAQFSGSEDATEQLKAYAAKALDSLGNLDNILGDFFNQYRSQLTIAGIGFGSFIGVKLTLALLSALNEIPLVQPTLELVGLSYTAWFVYRFILKADNRSELSEKYDGLKNQVLGKK
jgi:CAAD domains of cyanobacterial aminoacyl-tRNA synthetase